MTSYDFTVFTLDKVEDQEKISENLVKHSFQEIPDGSIQTLSVGFEPVLPSEEYRFGKKVVKHDFKEIPDGSTQTLSVGFEPVPLSEAYRSGQMIFAQIRKDEKKVDKCFEADKIACETKGVTNEGEFNAIVEQVKNDLKIRAVPVTTRKTLIIIGQFAILLSCSDKWIEIAANVIEKIMPGSNPRVWIPWAGLNADRTVPRKPNHSSHGVNFLKWLWGTWGHQSPTDVELLERQGGVVRINAEHPENIISRVSGDGGLEYQADTLPISLSLLYMDQPLTVTADFKVKRFKPSVSKKGDLETRMQQVAVWVIRLCSALQTSFSAWWEDYQAAWKGKSDFGYLLPISATQKQLPDFHEQFEAVKLYDFSAPKTTPSKGRQMELPNE